MTVAKATDFMDLAAERDVMAGILQHGADAYIDVQDLLTSEYVLRDDVNQSLFRAVQHYFHEDLNRKLDLPGLMAAAKDIGLGQLLADPDTRKYIKAFRQYPISKENVRGAAERLYKLSKIKDVDGRIGDLRNVLRAMNGSESLSQIVAAVETPLFEFTEGLNQQEEDGPVQIARDGQAWLDNLIANPCENIGVPSPFARYNTVIGGGFRRATITVVGARQKVGKTIFADNISLHIAGYLGFPALNVDTEMTRTEHLARILAHLTNIPIKKIERGHLSTDEAAVCRERMTWLESIPYHYVSVVGKSFEEQVAIMRRWIIKTVPVDPQGVRSDCLVVYDYLQAMDRGEFTKGDFKEHQILGFHMLSLLRVAAKCDVPILALVQLNRDGIDKETTAAISGSDRVGMKCSSFTILKKKTPEEIVEDGADEGNLKLVPIIQRHGEGLEDGDYINIKFAKQTAKMEEGRTRFALMNAQFNNQQAGVEIDGVAEELPFA